MASARDSSTINWSKSVEFYRVARQFFEEREYLDQPKVMLDMLSEQTGIDNILLIVNDNSDPLRVKSADNQWVCAQAELIDDLPLLYQSYEFSQIPEQDLSRVRNGLNLDVDTELSDGAFFALEVNNELSLLFVMYETQGKSRFSTVALNNIKHASFLLAQMVGLGNEERLGHKLRTHHKRESIWLESLAWLNEMSSGEMDDNRFYEFCRSAFFQLKTLVSAQAAVAIQYQNGAEQEVQVEGTQNDSFYQAIRDLIAQLRLQKDFSQGQWFSVVDDGLLKTTGALEVLVFPLFYGDDIRLILTVSRNENVFDDHEKKVALLFSEGVQSIIEKSFFLTSINNQNELLKKEKEEQKKLIEQLSEAQDQLLQQEKMASIGQLAAGVAHEINNPVGYVNANINSLESYVNDLFGLLEEYQSLESELSEDSAARDSVAKFKKEIDFDFVKEDIEDLIKESVEGIKRVKQIVQDLKDFSHVDKVEWQRADLKQGIESTLNIVSNEIKYKAEIIKDYDDIPNVECVPSQVNQVILNLLVNAGHAIEERGTITIRLKQLDQEQVYIEVEDTGKGISEEHLSKIFNPFFTTKPIGKGTGLGLSLSYSIAEKHNGKLSVTSEVGVGTKFRLTLPIHQDDFEE